MEKNSEVPEKKLELKYTYHEDVDLHTCEVFLNGESIYPQTSFENKSRAVLDAVNWISRIGIYTIIKNL